MITKWLYNLLFVSLNLFYNRLTLTFRHIETSLLNKKQQSTINLNVDCCFLFNMFIIKIKQRLT